MAYERMTVDEQIAINKRQLEEEHARRVAMAPKPQPPPPASSAPSEEALRQALRIGPPYPAHIAEHFRRFGAVIIENLPDTTPRDAYGNPPEVVQLSPEEQKFANALARIDALESRVAQLEAALTRFFGAEALDTERKVYR
jgi:hypothetical protein